MSISVHSCVSLCATEISGLLCLSRLSVKIIITQANIQLSPEGEVKSGVIYRDAEHRGIYLALFTDPEQSGISLNLRTGPAGHATLFNQ